MRAEYRSRPLTPTGHFIRHSHSFAVFHIFWADTDRRWLLEAIRSCPIAIRVGGAASVLFPRPLQGPAGALPGGLTPIC